MTDEELKQFKASLSITAVAQALGIEVVRGKCKCFYPQRHVHGDRTPSVSISEERGMFRCWVCDDVRGDVISLVQHCNGWSFLDALNWLKETYPFLVPGKGNRPISESRAAALEDKLVEKIVDPSLLMNSFPRTNQEGYPFVPQDAFAGRWNARCRIPCAPPHIQARMGQDASAHHYGLRWPEPPAERDLQYGSLAVCGAFQRQGKPALLQASADFPVSGFADACFAFPGPRARTFDRTEGTAFAWNHSVSVQRNGPEPEGWLDLPVRGSD